MLMSKENLHILIRVRYILFLPLENPVSICRKSERETNEKNTFWRKGNLAYISTLTSYLYSSLG